MELNPPKAFLEFLRAHPEYEKTRALDELRERDYQRLTPEGKPRHVYLDFTGGCLPPASLIREHAAFLESGVFGNPHSSNPTSSAATGVLQQARTMVLRHFNASPEEYVVIFTPNASGALKLVGESYPFEPGDQYMLPYDNHNSVLGIREFDRARGANTIYVPLAKPDLRISDETMDHYFKMAVPGKNNLFAYPAQSNFTGVQHPLAWVERAQGFGWDVILDAAAYVPTHRLDLSRVKPDFVTLSFYKMFGYPTGVGALIANRKALRKLHRPWFGGGTIVAVSVQGDQHFPARDEAGFEDGTLNYLSIPALIPGFRLLERIGMETIEARTHALASWLIDELLSFRHGNGAPLVKIYGPASMQNRGATLALNFFNRAGKPIDYRKVEAAANQANISLRTGCFCNPGTGELAFDLTKGEITTCLAGATRFHSTDEFRDCFEDDTVVGAIRVSLGLASNFDDVFEFARFAREFLQDY